MPRLSCLDMGFQECINANGSIGANREPLFLLVFLMIPLRRGKKGMTRFADCLISKRDYVRLEAGLLYLGFASSHLKSVCAVASVRGLA